MPARVKTIILLLIFFLFYLFTFEKYFKSTDEKLRTDKELFSFQRGELLEIHFENFSIEKKDNTYRIKTPVSHPASYEEAEKLFREYEKIISISKLNTENNFTFNVRKKITLIHKSGSDTLLLGESIKDKNLSECYAKVEGKNDIYVIKDEIFNLSDKPLSFYMDLKPFKFLEKGNAEIFWNKGKDEYLLKKINDTFLISETTQNSRRLWTADTLKSKKFFDLIQNFDFTDVSYEYENDKTPIDLIVKINNEKFLKKIYFYKKNNQQNQILIQFEEKGISFKVPEKLKDLFFGDFSSFASLNVFEGAITNLYKVSMELPKKNEVYSFYGKDTSWTIDFPYRWILSSAKILNFLLKVSVQEIQTFKEININEKPFLIFTFEYNDQKNYNDIIYFYHDVKTDEIIMKKNISNTLGVIKGDFFKHFDFDIFELVDKTPFNKIIEASNYLIIKNSAFTYKIQKNEFGKWFYDKSFSQKENLEIQNFILELSESKCHSSMSKKEGIDFGFDNPYLELNFSNQNNNFSFNVKIGSYSNEKDSFLLCNNDFFLFFKDFFLLKKFNTKETSGGKNANV